MKKDRVFNLRHVWHKHFDLWFYGLFDEMDNLYRFQVYDEGDFIQVGSNVIGKLQSIEQTSGGAFVDIGNGVEGFIRKVPKGAKIGDLLPLSIDRYLANDKGVRLTSGWHWRLRYAYLSVYGGGDKLKASPADDLWLNALLLEDLEDAPHHLSQLPALRYVAEGRRDDILSASYAQLTKVWSDAVKLLRSSDCRPQILANNNFLHNALLSMSAIKAPIFFSDKALLLQAEKSLQGLAPDLCDDFAVEKAPSDIIGGMQNLLVNPIIFGEGAEIFVDETEAATIIDLDSASQFAMHGKGGENGILQFNLQAAEEIIRLIGSMNLSGIILVDFIRLKNPHNRRLLTDRLKVLSKRLGMVLDILGYSRSGFVEILRRRTHLSLRRSPCYEQLALAFLERAVGNYKGGTIHVTANSGIIDVLRKQELGQIPIKFIYDESIFLAKVELL